MTPYSARRALEARLHIATDADAAVESHLESAAAALAAGGTFSDEQCHAAARALATSAPRLFRLNGAARVGGEDARLAELRKLRIL